MLKELHSEDAPESAKDPKRQTHNYTSELELKSLLIRIKNKQNNTGNEALNSRINDRIKKHTELGELKLDTLTSPQRSALRRRIYDNVERMSELTSIDTRTYERFGEIILLMIHRILTRPNFSGYSYRHDFYSDAAYKINKYLHNFDHNLISERTGRPVNAFAYISQYIHNSIIYIIKLHKKDNDNLNLLVKSKNIAYSAHNAKSIDTNEDRDRDDTIPEVNIMDIEVQSELEPGTLHEELKLIVEGFEAEEHNIQRLNVIYPKEYQILYDEYTKIKEYLKPYLSLIQAV